MKAVNLETAKGCFIADLLGLKTNKKGRYDTGWGDKTALGLFLTLQRFFHEDIPMEDMKKIVKYAETLS